MMTSMYSSLTAIIAAISMIFSSAPAKNANADLYERAQVYYNSADFTMSLTGESEIEEGSLDILDEMISSEQTQYNSSSPISIKSILTSLFDSGAVLNSAYNISSDGKSGSLSFSLDTDIALALSEQLSFTVDIGYSMWADYDFTSLENFKCEIIVLAPDDTRYVLYDLALLLDEEEKLSLLDGSLAGETMLQLPSYGENYAATLDALRKNSTVTADAKNHGQIVMTNEDMKNYIIEVLDISMRSAAEALPSSPVGIQSIEETIELSMMQPIKDFISGLDLFDEDEALVCDYYFDDNKNLIGSAQTLNFSFNLKEIWVKFSEFEDMMYTPDYPTDDTEEADAPVTDFEIDGEYDDPWHRLPEGRDDFVFSLKADLKYNKYGEAVDIKKPELTAKNTRNMYEERVSEEIFDSPYDTIYSYDTTVWVYEYGNAYWRDEITVPLRAFTEELCLGDEEIIFDSGNITINSNGSTELFDTIEMSVGSNVVVKDGKTFTLSAPVYVMGGSTRLTEEFFSLLWDGEIEDITVYTINRDETGYYYETCYQVFIPDPNAMPF